MSLHENENSTEAVHETAKSLKEFWKKVGSNAVYKSHTFGFLEGLVFHDGVYLADPMMKMIDEEFGSGDLH